MSEQTAGLEEEAADDIPVPETEEAEAQEAEAEAGEQEEDLEAQEGDEEEQEPEYDEFDFGGDKLQLPKGSVPDELRDRIEQFSKGTWGEYTRKSQELAEQRKSIEAQEKSVQKISGLNDEALQAFSRGLALKEELQQLQSLDLNQMWQSEPDRARQISDVISQKSAQLQNTVAEVQRKEAEASHATEAEMARRVEEGESLVKRSVKDFDPGAVKDYVLKNYGSMGITEAAADKWGANPATAIMAHKAMLFDRMQAKATKPAQKPAAKPVKPIKPTGKTGQRPFDPNRDAEKLSMDEWLKKERARVAKKQRG